MKTKLSPTINPVLAGLMILLSVIGCTGENDVTSIDFSRRVSVQQQKAPVEKNIYFRVAVGSMISPKETVGNYHQLLNHIASRLGRRIQLVQRKTYSEINELIGLGKIDLAFICSGPYVGGREKYGFEALAMPRVRGSHFYQAYLIVNKNSSFRTLDDLGGKTFAFTDPESNTGRLVPAYWLKLKGKSPDLFFGKTIYTYSHDSSIMAVAMSLVDGASVHGHIWEYYNKRDPMHTARTRIIRKSDLFGNPPVVVSNKMPEPLKENIRALLLNMHQTPEGKKILDGLMIERFVTPREECYKPILTMMSKN
jgi:phosphonate transport system substrate-binding protein